MNFNDYIDFKPGTFRRTGEGYMTGRLRVTGAGVFRYQGENGVERILRPLAEVSAQKSLDSMRGKPVTLHHPSVDVDITNVDQYGAGLSGTDPEFDGLNVWVTLTVTDRTAIEAMESGKVRAISCGYSADIESAEGNWQGTEYTRAMRNIRYNHIALVEEGRAGDSVRFSVGDCMELISQEKEPQMANRQIVIDGAVFECDEKTAEKMQAMEKAVNDAAEREKAIGDELDAVKAERDAKTAEIDALKAQVADEAVNARIEAKVALMDAAKRHGCDVKVSDSDADIKKAVIAKVYGDGFGFEGKSDAYIDAAFDLACSAKKNTNQLAANPAAGTMTDDAESAYKAMNDGIGCNKEG